MEPTDAVHAPWTSAEVDRQLANLYYASGDPGSYGGVERLYQRALSLGIPAKRNTVKSFLSKQLAYSLHKPVRHKFVRNHTYVANIDQQWQADLADMQTLSTENDGYHYLLTVVDVLSRFAWVVPVRSKSAKDMLSAFKLLFRQSHPRVPQRLQTDKGKEFFNSSVSGFLREKQVHHFASNSDQKAAIVERFNRTLKNRIWTYFTANDTKRYVNVLPDIVDSYNHTKHRSTGMQPADIDNEQAAQKSWRALFYRDASKIKPATERNRIGVGERTRITRWKGEFEKGYLPNWSREHFVVREQLSHPQSVYKLEDASGEPIEGVYYRSELQNITRNTRQVESILERRGRGTHREALIKWRGWPEKFNSWIPHSDLEKYSTAPRNRNDND